MDFSANASLSIDDQECGYVLQVDPADRCEFVRTCQDCLDGAGRMADYTQLYFCTLDGRAGPALALLLSWLAFLFVGLATAAEDFFCPNLASIAAHLRMSHNVAGVTLLALGNGAPDLFSALAGAGQGRPQLVLGQLMGDAALLSTAVAGAVCIAAPFHLMVRPFFRDVAFLAAAGFWAFWVFYR